MLLLVYMSLLSGLCLISGEQTTRNASIQLTNVTQADAGNTTSLVSYDDLPDPEIEISVGFGVQEAGDPEDVIGSDTTTTPQETQTDSKTNQIDTDSESEAGAGSAACDVRERDSAETAVMETTTEPPEAQTDNETNIDSDVNTAMDDATLANCPPSIGDMVTPSKFRKNKKSRRKFFRRFFKLLGDKVKVRKDKKKDTASHSDTRAAHAKKLKSAPNVEKATQLQKDDDYDAGETTDLVFASADSVDYFAGNWSLLAMSGLSTSIDHLIDF